MNVHLQKGIYGKIISLNTPKRFDKVEMEFEGIDGVQEIFKEEVGDRLGVDPAYYLNILTDWDLMYTENDDGELSNFHIVI